MATNQPILHAVPGRSANGAFLYIVQFDTGSIKVGRTANPVARLKAHAAAARTQGVQVTAQWVSQAVPAAPDMERKLLGFCSSRYASLNGGEYFASAVAQEVLTHAESLSLQMTQVDVFSGQEGRPKVGTKVEVRLPAEVLAQVDERAATENVSRAEMIRKLVTAGL
jgi:hypothetical protein